MAAILLVTPIYLTTIPTTFPFTPTSYLSNIAQYNNFTEIQDGGHFVGCPDIPHTHTNNFPFNTNRISIKFPRISKFYSNPRWPPFCWLYLTRIPTTFLFTPTIYVSNFPIYNNFT